MFILFCLISKPGNAKTIEKPQKDPCKSQAVPKGSEDNFKHNPTFTILSAGVQPPGVRVPGDGEARDLLPQVRGDRPSLWPPHQGDTVPGQGDEGELQEPHLREIRGEEADCKSVRGKAKLRGGDVI